jgi:uncharacterized protein YkwD
MRLPHLLPTLTVALALLSISTVRPPAVVAVGVCAMGVPASPAQEELAAVDAINASRAAGGLAPLTISATLTRAAAEKSASMAAGAPFAHDDADRTWQQRLSDCGYDVRTYVSENIAAGTETGAETVRMWQNSPGHRDNMLHPDARVVGIARARGGAYGWYWTANFGAE